MKKQDTYNKIIGYNKNTKRIYLLDYIFVDDNFQGATGTRFDCNNENYFDELNTFDYIKEYCQELYIMAVSESGYTDSLDEFVEGYLYDSNIDIATEKENSLLERKFVFQDMSSFQYLNESDILKILPDTFVVSCSGVGRMFNKELFEDSGFVAVDDKLIQKIKQIENIK